MEDFKNARDDEHVTSTEFQSEWLDSQIRVTRINKLDSDLLLAFNPNDKQAQASEKTQPVDSEMGAWELDRDLKAFANTKLVDPSRDLQKFQYEVFKFCENEDKESAFDDLSDTWSKINSVSELKAETLSRAIKEEAKSTPGRTPLIAALKLKQDAFWDKMFKQPLEESFRIQDLMLRQPGENKTQQDERIRKGLASNKPMLAAFEEIKAAEAKVDANKGPREKQLEALRVQLDSESEVMRNQMEKAYLRSTFK
ncbi:MAG: hypothetical protein K2X77_12095 [Candidatus Obscuribacterales bacterium]|jgi:hypothetical protein|nr:hypothetical protein [Candidatus Obscuribacterales bacterium]